MHKGKHLLIDCHRVARELCLNDKLVLDVSARPAEGGGPTAWSPWEVWTWDRCIPFAGLVRAMGKTAFGGRPRRFEDGNNGVERQRPRRSTGSAGAPRTAARRGTTW